MENFLDSLYDYDYSGVNDEERPFSHTAVDQSKLVRYTDISSDEEEEDLHVDINFDEPIDLAIN